MAPFIGFPIASKRSARVDDVPISRASMSGVLYFMDRVPSCFKLLQTSSDFMRGCSGLGNLPQVPSQRAESPLEPLFLEGTEPQCYHSSIFYNPNVRICLHS